MLMEVTCRCGWTTRGSESQVIRGIQAHAKADHDLALTPDDVRAVWRVVDDEAPPGPVRRGRA
jgi:predicted small metal-binding protein